MKQNRYFLIENLIVFALIAEIIGIGLMIEFIINIFINNEEIGFIWFIALVSWCALWSTPFFVANKNQLGRERIEPNVLETTDLEKYLKNFAEYFSAEEVISENVSDAVSYLLAKKRGTEFRILFVHMKDFDKKEYDKVKRRANRYINNKHDVSQYTALSGPRKMRVNIIVVDQENDQTDKISEQNADRLFSRVEPILNVIACVGNGCIKVPAHFGINGIYDYNKIWNILKQTLRQT